MGVSQEVLAIDDKCPSDLRAIKEEDVVVWVDPLDGTSEFASAAKTNSCVYFLVILKALKYHKVIVFQKLCFDLI